MRTGTEPIKTRDGNTDEEILAEARERATYAYEQWRTNFDMAEAELEFLYGDQWPAEIKAQREAQGKPCLSINTLPAHLDQVQGDQRMARPSIHISPADDADIEVIREPETDGERENMGMIKPIPLASVFEGAIRNIEYQSGAEMHYDAAFQHQIEAGIGWLRVITDYVSEDSFDQTPLIKHIRHRFSVLIDPDASEPDYSDANYCFIAEKMPRKEFEKRYPNAIQGTLTEDLSWWGTDDSVTVAEYYRREPMERELLLLQDGKTVFADQLKIKGDDGKEVDTRDEIEPMVVKSKKVKTFRVLWSKITAHSILEKARPVPGRMIPVAPVLGKHVDTREGPIYRGLTRYAADAKRMHNFMMSAATERIALSPRSPWVGTVQMFAGHESLWQAANVENRAFLPYNPDPEAPGGKPERADFSPMPAGELQVALSMGDMVKATIGQYDASLGAQSNETSGKAIMARQREGDVGAFTFVDNLNRAIEKIGRILVETIPEIFDTERLIRIRHVDDKTSMVRINKVVLDEDTGQEVLVNDIATGRYDVKVKSGPSFTTQREEAVEALLQFMQAAPSTAPAIMDLLAMNMDWPGADKVAERLRRMVPRNILSEREVQDLPEPEPSPEQQAEMAKAQAEMKKAEADMAMAQAKTMEAQAKLAQIESLGNGDLEELVKNIVAGALAELQQLSEAGNERDGQDEPA